MTARQRRLLIATAVLLGALMFLWSAPPVADGSVSDVDAAEADLPDLDVAPSALASPAAVPPAGEPIDLVTEHHYALAFQEIAGLPIDVVPGTRIELWVTWDPPITRRPKLHRLIREVVISDVVSGADPKSPSAVILALESSKMPDLLWADRYGSLSAVLLDR